eukprot:GFYU01028544.1.p1 GENE.GFYU01028544.1~~GFYU01028544.1.p1  ORF type:complete len:104 (-),score=26.53 GFYU01028544.1:55-366(-)
MAKSVKKSTAKTQQSPATKATNAGKAKSKAASVVTALASAGPSYVSEYIICVLFEITATGMFCFCQYYMDFVPLDAFHMFCALLYPYLLIFCVVCPTAHVSHC